MMKIKNLMDKVFCIQHPNSVIIQACNKNKN
jgi:hypothetical protein